MDALPQLGRGIFEVLDATFAAYEPLLLPRESEIRSTQRETHQYGPDPRQALDIYYPPPEAAAAAAAAAAAGASPRRSKPVLVFCYGGGFVQGERRKPQYARDLVFANLGHYFAARHGLTVVVPDYRLLSHGARFPSGGADVALVVDWIARELPAKKQREGYAAIDLFLLGNSVGGVHVSTWALHPEFADSVASLTKVGAGAKRDGSGTVLRGLMLLGVPVHFGGDDNEILRAYFGDGAGDIVNNAPLGLLQAAKKRVGGAPGSLLPGVKIALLLSELDPEYIYQSAKEFEEAWPTPGAVKMHILKGHNHISPQVSLGTGIEKEEAWGVQVADFVRASAGN